MNNESLCRTAPATLGLLITYLYRKTHKYMTMYIFFCRPENGPKNAISFYDTLAQLRG